ncbi:hypothetical protein KJ652_00115 [Patescibacteria group bacterium]|nr:hypothetical protein [Patescibacteria group bacterium]MBU1122977.1 hypothetical protein [Patescibacteria group bacterium]MBU1911632.1 hypothetical protein [Patescibacteria group bacterium]
MKDDYSNLVNPTAVPPGKVRQQLLNAMVYIDGNNWFNRLKELLNENLDPKYHSIRPPIEYELRNLCQNLVSPHKLIGVRYYIGTIKQIPDNPKNHKLYAG